MYTPTLSSEYSLYIALQGIKLHCTWQIGVSAVTGGVLFEIDHDLQCSLPVTSAQMMVNFLLTDIVRC